jgi:transposase-like protein
VLTDPPTLEVYPPYPGTWQQFCSWFADEQACAAYLEKLRWPTGVRCPKCEGAKGWRTADGRWSCSGCGRKVSVTAGTIFDRSRISLQEWFAAAWYMTNQKHGVSALGLQRLLGLGSYQTAWTILQKLRTAMVGQQAAQFGHAERAQFGHAERHLSGRH